MSMYIPEIKDEVSENAKMLVEDGGKIVRTGMPSGGSNATAALIMEESYASWMNFSHGNKTITSTKHRRFKWGENEEIIGAFIFADTDLEYIKTCIRNGCNILRKESDDYTTVFISDNFGVLVLSGITNTGNGLWNIDNIMSESYYNTYTDGDN